MKRTKIQKCDPSVTLALVVYLYVESWTAVGLFDVSPAKVIILGKRNQPRGKKEEYSLGLIRTLTAEQTRHNWNFSPGVISFLLV